MQYDSETWQRVVSLLASHGFVIESADREEGRIVVRVP